MKTTSTKRAGRIATMISLAGRLAVGAALWALIVALWVVTP